MNNFKYKKMKICVFDTETTWFINKKETDLNKQPRIIQFAWIIWNFENLIFLEKERINILINPSIPIPFQSSNVHNIYDIDVKDALSIEYVIDNIIWHINNVDVIIWHNIEYDENMIKLELKRLNKEYLYSPKQVICTMKSSINYCALEWNWNRFKYPKLWELHKKIFNKYFIWAHDALTDVEATLKCFIELVNNWIIKVQNKKEVVMSLF